MLFTKTGRLIGQCLLALSLVCNAYAQSPACTVTDASGAIVTLSHPAQRIISLAPDLTEILLSLGAGKRVVGVIAGSDYPPEAKTIQRVGNHHSLNMELILALHPDLIVAWGESHAGQLAQLKRFHIAVYVSHSHHLLDITQTLQDLGCLIGEKAKAKAQAQAFMNRYHALVERYYRPEKIPVFYEIAAEPLITINKRSWINDAITLCGGKNIFADEGISFFLKQTAFAVSPESVVAAHPSVIIVSQAIKGPQPILKSLQPTYFTLNPDLIERASPRVLEGVEALCQSLAKTSTPIKSLALQSTG